jgi:hypothetical protein
VVCADASETVYGGYCVQTGNAVSNGVWEESERIQSSTWRELVAVERVLCPLPPFTHRRRFYYDQKLAENVADRDKSQEKRSVVFISAV